MIKLRIYEYLLRNHKLEIFTALISEKLKCSNMFVSKTIKELIAKNIAYKDAKNSVKIINPFLLATYLAYSENFPSPLFFEMPEYKDLIFILNKTLYSITLDSAVEILNNKIPSKIYAYVDEDDVEHLFNYLNPLNKESGNCLIVFPQKSEFFTSFQSINEVLLANNYQIFIDLLRVNKISAANKLLKDENLF
ncbi:MAG: hypothetical protein PHN56_01980 [Candidatus Nanoarchaeia archaeon]|nr:hypothetical protein [Candidatus Nanoarchaeia archaeon]